MNQIDNYLKKINAPSDSWCVLLDSWISLVEDCENGYGSNEYEFDFDANERGYLEKLLNESALPDEMLKPLRDSVDRIDQRLKCLFQENVKRNNKSPYWWKHGVLKRAGWEYVDSLKAKGISVELIE